MKNNTPHWQSKQGQQLHFSFFFYEEDQNTEEPDLSTEAPEDCNHCQSNWINIQLTFEDMWFPLQDYFYRLRGSPVVFPYHPMLLLPTFEG